MVEKAKMRSKAGRRQPTHQADEYHYIVGWSEEDRAFVGRVAEFESLAAHGRTLESALREIKAVVQAVLEDLAESGEDIPQPFSKRRFSGKLHLRMPERLHRQLALEAAQQGISLNQLINLKLTAA
jgi:predicted HicB family RNase H-like nuclease